MIVVKEEIVEGKERRGEISEAQGDLLSIVASKPHCNYQLTN